MNKIDKDTIVYWITNTVNGWQISFGIIDENFIDGVNVSRLVPKTDLLLMVFQYTNISSERNAINFLKVGVMILFFVNLKPSRLKQRILNYLANVFRAKSKNCLIKICS